MIIFGCFFLTTFTCVWLWSELRDASLSLDNTENRLETLRTQVTEYQLLSKEQQDTLFGTKPQQDIESRIASTIRSAQISPTPRYSVSVQDDRVFRPNGIGSLSILREQEISIRIPGLSVEEIGRFLIDWRMNQQVWAPSSIEMVHDQRAENDRYTLQLICTAVYHAEGTP